MILNLRKPAPHPFFVRMAMPLFACLAGIPAVQALESPVVDRPRVRVSLVSDRDSVAPGEDLFVGVRFRLEKNWHVYWKNPGDTGLAPKFEVHSGAAPEWLYPVPERVSISERFVNYGYHGDVVIPARVIADRRDFEGDSWRFRVRTRFLVCEKQCIPARAELELSIPRADAAGDAGSAAESPLIDAWRARLPLPLPSDWSHAWEARRDAAVLVVNAPAGALPAKPGFIPETQGWLVHSAAFRREFRRLADGRDEVRFTFPVQAGSSQDLGRAAGLLTDPVVAGRAWELPARFSETGAEREQKQEAVTLPLALALAFLGGLILNLMPCVFPVLWLKLLGLVRQSSRSRTDSLAEGGAYSLGVVLSFAALAGVLLVLRGTGEKLGWGFQLQSPVFVTALALLFFGLGLQLLGVLELGSALGALGGEGLVRLTRARSETAASFWTGALAVVVATPCTAPFMGAALGFAIAQPAAVALSVFVSLGFGMAAPFLAVSAFPRELARVLPRPGKWMEVLKQAMAFPLFATALWLLWVLSVQGGQNGGVLVVPALVGLIGVSGASWLFRRSGSSRGARRISVGLLLLSVCASLAGVYAAARFPSAIEVPVKGGEASAEGLWSPWSEAAVAQAVSEGRPVFVDFTAAWCVTCQVNEKVALSSARILDLFREKRVSLLKGDWTNEDARITAELERRGRSGVPLYLLFDPRSPTSPVILPQLLTEESVAAELRKLP